jgi:hypothetical protein
VLEIPSTRARPATSRPTVIDMTCLTNNNDRGGTTYEDEEPLPEKRPRIERVEHLEEMSYWPNSPEG